MVNLLGRNGVVVVFGFAGVFTRHCIYVMGVQFCNGGRGEGGSCMLRSNPRKSNGYQTVIME